MLKTGVLNPSCPLNHNKKNRYDKLCTLYYNKSAKCFYITRSS